MEIRYTLTVNPFPRSEKAHKCLKKALNISGLSSFSGKKEFEFMKFTSNSGVAYWFDDVLGISFPLNTGLEKMLTLNTTTRTNEGNRETGMDADYNVRFLKKIEKIRQRSYTFPQEKITPEMLKQYILREGLLQLTLSITENCNLACTYCCYSEAYPGTRNPSKKKMNFQTAKAALDYYASLLEEGIRFNPYREPSIGFYGGEPLLNFDLIKQCVSYFNHTYPKIKPSYAITTNGTLLDAEKRDFLMEHDFSIAVSLDGPEKEHNRKRVYRDGSGTFADIMKNVKPILDAGYNKCHAICVFDWQSDLFAIQDFFSRKGIPKPSVTTLPNLNDGCTYYDNFTKGEYKKFQEMDARAYDWYLLQRKNTENEDTFFDLLYGLQSGKSLFGVAALVDQTSWMIPYSGACVPGRKILVDVEGNYHICERINETFPIGNISTGLDFNRITQILEDYQTCLDQCPSCTTKKMCGLCYCAFAKAGKFKSATQTCLNPENSSIKELERSFSIAEINPTLPESIADGYYNWLSGISATMED